MKIIPVQPSIPTSIMIELTADEAHKLTDIMGCNIAIPDAIGVNRSRVKAFIDTLFNDLNKLGFRRNEANWGKNENRN